MQKFYLKTLKVIQRIFLLSFQRLFLKKKKLRKDDNLRNINNVLLKEKKKSFEGKRAIE